jgi:5-methylcytosine-specific restriction endonuclease McrA
MPHKDPEVRRAYIREWKARNSSQHKWLNKLADAAMHANARAEKYGCEGRLSAQDIRECFEASECYYCGKATDLPTVDHVIPLHDGGPNDATNIVMACRPCNISKWRSDRPWRWSQIHDRCITCGGVDARHAAKGVCLRCYSRQRSSAS